MLLDKWRGVEMMCLNSMQEVSSGGWSEVKQGEIMWRSGQSMLWIDAVRCLDEKWRTSEMVCLYIYSVSVCLLVVHLN